eukprot:10581960-Lingulodinium_polyedra.AAC.1
MDDDEDDEEHHAARAQASCRRHNMRLRPDDSTQRANECRAFQRKHMLTNAPVNASRVSQPIA